MNALPFHRQIFNPTHEQITDAYRRQHDGEWKSVIVAGGAGQGVVLNYQVVKGWRPAEGAQEAREVALGPHSLPGNSDPAIRRVPRPVTPRDAAVAYERAADRIPSDSCGSGGIPWPIPKPRRNTAIQPTSPWPEPGKPMPPIQPSSGPGPYTILTCAFLAFCWTIIVGVLWTPA